MNIAFFLLRPHRLFQDFVLDRSDPDLSRLEKIRSPESFVWKILSHAARTFSACILFLPSQLAVSAAIAYLYCRILDTYEDLVPDPTRREAMLAAFIQRFHLHPKGYSMDPAPPIDDGFARNTTDRIYTLLVNRCRLIDAVFSKLKVPFQRIIVDLVRKMAGGMIWSSRIFENQKGVLGTPDQLSRYCRNVLGNPTVFAARLMNLFHHKSAHLPRGLYLDALKAGEFIQLANVTRDIESDLKRKIAYHPLLQNDLGRRDIRDPELSRRIDTVREVLLVRALSLAPAYIRMAERMHFPRLSLCRGSMILMLLFTERYYRACARRIGRAPWSGPESGLRLIFLSFLSILSGRYAQRHLDTVGAHFAAFVRKTRRFGLPFDEWMTPS